MTPFRDSNLWTCHRALEAFCAERAEMLIKYMDALFADVTNVVGLGSVEMLIRERSDNGKPSSTIEEYRQLMDKMSMLTHVKSMQLEVFRRATERVQGECDALADHKSSLIKQVNTQVSHKTPTLPDEVIAQIFSLLYWTEDCTSPSHEWCTVTDINPYHVKPTLRRLLDDHGTSARWKDLIRRQIPVAVAYPLTKNAMRKSVNRVGNHPTELSTEELNDSSKELLARPTTTVFLSLTASPSMKELEIVGRLPCNNMVVSVEAWWRGDFSDKRKTITSFFEKFGQNLGNLDILEIQPFQYTSRDVADKLNILDLGVLAFRSSKAEASRGHAPLPSKIRVARVPPFFLLSLRPILGNITTLETDAPICNRSVQADIDAILKLLQSSFANLISLSLMQLTRSSDTLLLGRHAQSDTSYPSTIGCRYLFPRLTHFKLSFSEHIVSDLLPLVDCPLLSHISLITWTDSKHPGIHFSPKQLQKFPTLKSIAINLQEFPNGVFFSALSNPLQVCGDAWLLPRLESIELGDNMRAVKVSNLKPLKTAVINRLKSGSAKPIRSVSIYMLESLPRSMANADVEALKLYVPEVIIKSDHTW